MEDWMLGWNEGLDGRQNRVSKQQSVHKKYSNFKKTANLNDFS